MSWLTYLVIGVWVAIIVLPMGPVFAQKTLPQVPITYRGDTDKTIIRRAQWVEEAKKEGTVVWWGSDKPEEMNQITAEFNKVYPFIKVSYWRGQDKERVTRLEAEHAVGRLTYDISDAGDFTSYPRWRGMGLVDKYTDIIPGIEKRDKKMYSKHGDWAQLGNNAIVPMYNTKVVSTSEAPKSWEDLLNPKWKGKIGMTPDVKAWYVLALGDGGWGIEKTEDFLRKLKQQEPIWTRGHSGAVALLIAGEFKIMGENYLRYALQAQDKGAPANWCRVTPIPITGGTFLLAKKAPHPNATRLFIEWLFSPPGLATYEKVTGYGAAAPGSGTRLAKALENLPLVYRTEDVVLKTAELRLVDRFAQILGVTPE